MWSGIDLDAGLLVVRRQRVALGYAVAVGPTKTATVPVRIAV
jgi:hypothetical protein